MSLKEKIAGIFRKAVLSDEKRYRLQFLLIYILLAIFSAAMTVVNIATKERPLMIATLIFAVLMIVNIVLASVSVKTHPVSRVLFVAEILALCSFFLFSGAPQGFSAIWIVMIPSLGMLLFGRKYCTIISAIMFAIMVFALWIPYGQSLLWKPEAYSDAFKLRYPLIFIAFYAAGFLFEEIRILTFRNYRFACTHDGLTGALNRHGFYDYVENAPEDSKQIGFVIFDIDLFKNVNDTYGHFVGDEILKSTYNAISDELGIPVCRWGGEEFTAFIATDEINAAKIEETVNNYEKIEKVINGITLTVTISAGAYFMPRREFDLKEISMRADDCLYKAKEQGRNRAVIEIDE